MLAGSCGTQRSGAAAPEAGRGEHGGPRALAAYAAVSGTAVPDTAALAPFAAARRVEAAVWTVAMAAVAPSRYARLVDRALADALGTAGG